jgi:SHS2 domain-containing protein|tara:strand:- start:881 stop:1294 length:414 start_codon:yes stop_codon:yes gene_type:complete
MVKYKFIEGLTSDVMYEAYGKNLKELFSNAAEALFSVICEIKKVKPKEPEEFEIKAENVEDLLVNWLQGLIAIVDIEQRFFSKFEIEGVDEEHVIAKLWGEPIRPELGGTVVKAVTNYNYKFEKTKKGYKVRVSLDI